VTWKLQTDHLRCSPEFYSHPRYDCIILRTHDGPIFAQLKFAFTVVSDDDTIIPIILVQAFDKHNNSTFRGKDRDLELIRLRQRPVKSAEFFFARSIIRGTVIFPAYDEEKDSVLFDILDTDTFLRSKEMI
jgi:hypothetical protein